MAAKRTLTVEILGDAKGAVAAFGNVNKGLGGLGSDFVAFGKKVALGFAAFTAGAIVIGKDFVSAASDLNESLSKTNVVFGDAAQAVIDFSKTTATALGQSQRAALDAAGTFGVFGKAAGLSGKDLSNFTIDLVTLASDMASFSNTTPEEAVLALGAALRGEMEPIRKYGVMLDDAALKAKAMEMGIYDGNGALDQQQKVLAASALIFEQTTDAQGDFARTSDGLANTSRVLAARFDDLKTRIGTFLLPIALKIVEAFGWLADKAGELADKYLPKLRDMFDDVKKKVQPVLEAIRDELQPVLEKIVQWMKDNTDVVKVFFGVLAGAAVAASVAFLASALLGLLNPVVLIITSIALLAAGLYYAYTRFEWFRDAVDKTVAFFEDEIVPAFEEAFQKMKTAVEVFVEGFKIVWSVFGDGITKTFTGIWSGIQEIFSNALEGLSGVWDFWAGLFTLDFGRVWEGLKQTFSGLVGTIAGIATTMFAPVSGALSNIGSVFSTAFGVMRSVAGSALEWVKQQFIQQFTIVSNAVRTIFNGITGTIKSVLQGAINFFVSGINKVIGVINGAIRAYNAIPLVPDIGTISPVPRVQLAKGGIVTGPTIALVGEAGPEMVVPLTGPYRPDFLDQPASSSKTIVVNVQAGLVSSPDEVGAQIIDAIRRAERRSGQVFAAA